jgi:signal transduction histidine kinase
VRTIEQIESLDELRGVDPLRVTRPWLYGLGSLVAAYLVVRFETEGLWSIAIGLALMVPVSYFTGRWGWDHVILAMDALLMGLIVLRSGMSPASMGFLWATHLGSAILLYQGYQRRVVIGAIGVAISSSYLGSGVIVPLIPVDASNLRYAEVFAMIVGIIAFLSVMPLAASLIKHRFVLQASMVEEAARRLSMQRQFTSMVSHELRGPLTSIRGFAQLLLDSETLLEADERTEIHGLIEREAENLNTLVDDILIILRFESGNLHVAAENVNVRRAADEIMLALAHMARGNDVVINIDPAHTAVGDGARIRQVIRNLVTNAIKYGGTRIEITSELCGDTLHLSVVDDGDGIPSALRYQLFNDYAQGANADESTGYGLGLGISRRLAHLMDGELVYEDAQPSGAHFTLALPAA